MTDKKKSYVELSQLASEKGLAPMFASSPLSHTTSTLNTGSFISTERARFYAAIDLGSNTCRLLITKKQGQEFTTQDVCSRIVRLAEGLSRTGKLSEFAMQRTINAIAQYARKIRAYGSNIQVMAIATEACRRASNADLFLERILRRTGIRFTIIDEMEESFFVAKGCFPLMNTYQPYGIFLDIGGGSTEVIWAKQRNSVLEIIDSISLPFGVVHLSETVDMQKALNYTTIVNKVFEACLSFSQRHAIGDRIDEQRVQMIGTSGTTTTLAAIHQNLRAYDRRKIDRSLLTFDNIERVIKSLQLMSPSELSLHPCVGPERSELILAGTAILDGLCKAFPVGCLQVADRGVRDGMASFMAYGDQRAPDHRHYEGDAIFVA